MNCFLAFLEIWVFLSLSKLIYALLIIIWWHFIWFLLFQVFTVHDCMYCVGFPPLTVLMFGWKNIRIFRVVQYHIFIILSSLFWDAFFKGILDFISYKWNKISQFYIFVFCSILLDYFIKNKSLRQKNIFDNI